MSFWSISALVVPELLDSDVKTGSEQQNVDIFVYEFLGFSFFSLNTDALENAQKSLRDVG